jgi:hypothetical protein
LNEGKSWRSREFNKVSMLSIFQSLRARRFNFFIRWNCRTNSSVSIPSCLCAIRRCERVSGCFWRTSFDCSLLTPDWWWMLDSDSLENEQNRSFTRIQLASFSRMHTWEPYFDNSAESVQEWEKNMMYGQFKKWVAKFSESKV